MKEIQLIQKQINKLSVMENSILKIELSLKIVERINKMYDHVLFKWVKSPEREQAIIILKNMLSVTK